jgi:ribosomal protein L12E/L44/L45/RPP1/RPP2
VVPSLRRVSSDDVHAHEKQLKQNSLSNITTRAAVAGGARHRTRQATAHTQQQEQQQEQQDEHKELEKQEVQECKE